MSQESSLTAPEDRDLNNKWRPQVNEPSLSKEQTETALKELNVTSFTDKFPRVDRTYADPVIHLQTYGLISFIPAKGATPNERGIYGFAKLRGNYGSELEANQRAEYLISNVDSYHQIYHTYVGRPFPLTTSSDYSAETSEVEIRKDIAKNVSESIRGKRQDEQQQVKEIQEREKRLLEESKREEADPYEEYITQKVKLAQLSWTYLEHQKKMSEIKEIVIKTREIIKDMDDNHPTFKNDYFEKYMTARREAGIKESESEAQSNFIKFLVEDADLGF